MKKKKNNTDINKEQQKKKLEKKKPNVESNCFRSLCIFVKNYIFTPMTKKNKFQTKHAKSILLNSMYAAPCKPAILAPCKP